MDSPVFLIDTHTHLTFSPLASQVAEVLARARAAGVRGVITLGVDLDSSRECVALAERYPEVYAAVGWHPSEADRAPANFLEELAPLTRHPKVVAVGEIGIDFYRGLSRSDPPEQREKQVRRQREVFEAQLRLAAETGLPCVVHSRAAFREVMEWVRPFVSKVPIVLHCFSEGPAEVAAAIEAGLWVSFTGIVTYKNARNVQATAREVPSDRFFLETDAPFLAPVPHRGKTCEPAWVVHTAAYIARLRGVSLEELAAQTTENARRFFPRLGTLPL